MLWLRAELDHGLALALTSSLSCHTFSIFNTLHMTPSSWGLAATLHGKQPHRETEETKQANAV